MKISLPELLPGQYDFITDTTTRHLALCGGYGAGKTHGLALKLIVLAAMNAGYAGLAMSPTAAMARDLLVPAIEDHLNIIGVPFEYSKSLMKFRINFGANKATMIHMLGSENYKRIVGYNLAFVGFDEVDTMDTDVASAAWKMAQARVRKGKVMQLACVSTPEGFKFMHTFFEQEACNEDGSRKTDRRLIRAKTRDNPFLDPTTEEYCQRIIDNNPPLYAEAYLEGKFVNFSTGNVYYTFDRNVNHTTATLDDFPNNRLHIGMDFNVGNCTAIVSVINDKREVLVLDEITKVKNTEAMANEIHRRYARYRGYINIYPDAAGASPHTNSNLTDIAILKDPRYAFNVMYHAKSPAISSRVGAVNTKIKNAAGHVGLYINTVKCPNMTKTFEQQGYVDNAPDKSPSLGLDHAADALGYFIWYQFPITIGGTIRVI